MNRLFIGAVTTISLLLTSCSTGTLKTKTALGPNKEYEEKVTIKPIEPQPTPAQALQAGGAVPQPTPKPSATPTLGLEPSPTPIAKSKKTSKAAAAAAPTASPSPGATPAIAPHLPDIEDPKNFNGRRPIVDPFRPGEKVTLMITYFGVSAGDATLEVKPFVEVNGRKAYHLYSKLTSSSVFNMVYKVDDFAEVFVDYNELVPITYVLSAQETKQIMDIRSFFDWKNMKADYWRKRVTSEETKEHKDQWKLEPYVQNTYSALWYIRMFPLEVGKTYRYKVIDEGKIWEVKAKVLRKEMLRTDVGTFPTVVVEPEVHTGGILKKEGEVLFWYTDDDRKFPVKFEAKIKIGKLIGYLKALDKGQEVSP